MNTKTILIISTDATRTGTPILLLDIFDWISKNSSYKFIFILQDGGVLLPNFQKLGKVYLWNNIVTFNLSKFKLGLLFVKILKKIGLLNDGFISKLFIKKIQRTNNVVLTYSNTARNGNLLVHFAKVLKNKILTHVHEGEKTLQLWNKNGYVDYNFLVSYSFISVSQSVKGVLIRDFNIRKNINVIPGAISINAPITNNLRLKEQLGIATEKKILLCCGWLGWHKGTDFFMQLAYQISKVRNDIMLIWLGGSEQDESYLQMMYDIHKMNLGSVVNQIASKSNVSDYMQIADIFLMLSRDESFSLVTAEAGWAGKPVLCFDKSGGPCEIVNYDKRFIVPYGDINALCLRITDLIDKPIERNEMGTYLKNRISSYYTIEKTAPQILEQIEELII